MPEFQVRPKILPDNYYRFEVFEIKKEIQKAYLLDLGDITDWFPKSQVMIGYDPELQNVLVVDMPQWIAVRKKLI